MKPVCVVTDSHSSISPEAAASLGVRILPMPFMITDPVTGERRSFLEGVDLNREEFFAYQRQGALISTSQPAPADVLTLWDELLEEYEALLYMPLSSGLSGSCATAAALAQEEPYAGRVFVVDHGRIAAPLHQTVLDALELLEKGCTAQQCKEILEANRDELCIYIAVETLEYLKKGGRISAATAAVGTLLNIKPILQLATGKLEGWKKARGMVKARELMLEAIRSDLAIRFRDAHARGDVHLLAAGSANDEETGKWLKQIEAAFPGMPVLYDPLSLGVSCHTGEGALGVGLSVRPHA